MNMKKSQSLMLVCTLCLLALSSCSNDEREWPVEPVEPESPYPIRAYCTGIDHWEDFNLYIGSEKGGIKQDTKGMNPRDIWEDRVDYNPVAFVFINDSVVLEDGWREMNYIIRHDSIFMKKYYEYDFVATGTQKDMLYHMGFLYSEKRDEYSFSSSIGQKTELQSYEKRFHLFTPEEMTHPDDRVAWCNVYYRYEVKEE